MRWDSQLTGFVVGLIAPVLGFFAYGLIHTTLVRPHLDMHAFVYDLFFGTKQFRAPILSLSLIANLAAFFIFDRMDRHKAMRGVILASLVHGAAIIMLWF